MKKAVKSKLDVLPGKEQCYFSESARRSIVAEIDGGLRKSEASLVTMSLNPIQIFIKKASRIRQHLLILQPYQKTILIIKSGTAL